MLKSFFIFIMLFFSQFNTCFCEKYELAIVSMFRDEARFLEEWIEFHKKQGVDHIYLINNFSIDDYKKVLKPYLKQKYITFWPCPISHQDIATWNTIQCSMLTLAGRDCDSKWIAFIDTDEFLFSPTNDLKTILRQYEDFGGVCVNWVMYGTSNVVNSHGKILDKLLWRAPLCFGDNAHVKTIVQKKYMGCCENPHFFSYNSGKYAVNENYEQVIGAFSPISVSKLRIHHYWARDLHFFNNVKLPRRKKWYPNEDAVAVEKLLNEEYDDIMLRVPH